MSNLLSQASLVMIPSGYKEDVVYSPVPTDGSGDLSFTRASNGTRVNSAGLVEVAPWNLLQQSESFSTSPWANTNVTLTSGQIDPNGGTTAFRAQFSGVSYLLQNLTALNGTNSVYAKAYGSTAKIRLCDPNGSFSTQYNLTTEWQRITTSGNALAGFSIDSYIDGVWTSQDIVMAFAQTNIGSTAKPYFPTTDRLNVPRLTYQNGGGGCPSLLLEKQSTNVLKYSEQFDDSNWTKAQGNGGTLPIITANYGISPDGTQNADRIQLTRTTQTSSYSYVYQTYSGTVGVAYTWSIWLKSLSGTPSVALSYDGSSYVNIVTLTTEWQRYTFTSNAINTDLQATFLLFQNLSGTSLSADFLAWGFQIEASSYATSYIPTTSSSATRVVDQSTTTLGSFIIGQSEGVFFVDVDFSPYSTGVYNNPQTILIRNGTSYANYIYIASHGTNGQLVASMVASGLFIYLTSTQTLPNRFKCALAYKSGDTVFYVNGNLAAISTTTFSPLTLNDLRLNHDEGSLKINQVALFKTRLTNAELASLTTL